MPKKRVTKRKKVTKKRVRRKAVIEIEEFELTATTKGWTPRRIEEEED